MGILPKLKIGAPNDEYEQEADRVAEQVVIGSRHPSTEPTPVQNNIQRMSLEGEDDVDAEEELVQRKSTSDNNTTTPRDTESFLHQESSGYWLGRLYGVQAIIYRTLLRKPVDDIGDRVIEA